MAAAIEKSLSTEPSPDLQKLLDDVAALKQALATLLRDSKAGAASAVDDAVAAGSEEASQLYETLKSQSGQVSKAVRAQIERQPVASVLVAFALGFLGCRLLAR